MWAQCAAQGTQEWHLSSAGTPPPLGASFSVPVSADEAARLLQARNMMPPLPLPPRPPSPPLPTGTLFSYGCPPNLRPPAHECASLGSREDWAFADDLRTSSLPQLAACPAATSGDAPLPPAAHLHRVSGHRPHRRCVSGSSFLRAADLPIGSGATPHHGPISHFYDPHAAMTAGGGDGSTGPASGVSSADSFGLGQPGVGGGGGQEGTWGFPLHDAGQLPAIGFPDSQGFPPGCAAAACPHPVARCCPVERRVISPFSRIISPRGHARPAGDSMAIFGGPLATAGFYATAASPPLEWLESCGKASQTAAGCWNFHAISMVAGGRAGTLGGTLQRASRSRGGASRQTPSRRGDSLRICSRRSPIA